MVKGRIIKDIDNILLDNYMNTILDKIRRCIFFRYGMNVSNKTIGMSLTLIFLIVVLIASILSNGGYLSKKKVRMNPQQKAILQGK